MKPESLPYKSPLINLARNNRKEMTKGEVILWSFLKGKKIANTKFRRQVPIGSYIVDFYCHEMCLIIEVQGYSHTLEEVATKDELRNRWLKEQGFNVLEIDDAFIFNDIDNVIAGIQFEIKKLRGE